MGETKCIGFHQEKDLIFSDCGKICVDTKIN